MSYQVSNEEAVRNAGDFIQAGMDAVKVEGCMVERVKAICDAGIMVMSHLGLTPHTVPNLVDIVFRVRLLTRQRSFLTRHCVFRMLDVRSFSLRVCLGSLLR